MVHFFAFWFRLKVTLFVVFMVVWTSSFAQEFHLYDTMQQLEARISQASDATLVINFWATWCKPCVEELPCFDDLKEQYCGYDIQILLVSLDFKSQVEKKFIPFLRAQKIKSEVALLADQDVNTWIPRIYEDWDGAIPATIVVRGNRRKFSLGKFSSLEELDAFVSPFLLDTTTPLKPVTCRGK
jgi:thiol-disulfide isomerase/thioredoxin